MLNSPNPHPTEEELFSLCGMWRWQFLVFALPIFYKEPPIQKSPTTPPHKTKLSTWLTWENRNLFIYRSADRFVYKNICNLSNHPDTISSVVLSAKFVKTVKEKKPCGEICLGLVIIITLNMISGTGSGGWGSCLGKNKK